MQLHELSRTQWTWAQMSTLITDDVLDTFAVVGPPDGDRGTGACERYGGLAQRVAFATPYDLDRDVLGRTLAGSPELRREAQLPAMRPASTGNSPPVM